MIIQDPPDVVVAAAREIGVQAAADRPYRELLRFYPLVDSRGLEARRDQCPARTDDEKRRALSTTYTRTTSPPFPPRPRSAKGRCPMRRYCRSTHRKGGMKDIKGD